MQKQSLVYGLVDPRTDTIHYVGQSMNGVVRARRHGRPGALEKDTNLHKIRWIRQVRASGNDYSVVILEIVLEVAHLDEAEIRWIAYGREHGWPLTNLCDGGGGTKNPNQETRAKIGVASRTRKHPPWSTERHVAFELNKSAWLETQKQQNRNRPWTTARRDRFEHGEERRKSEGRKHHEPSTETRARWSQQRKGRQISIDQRLKQSIAMKRACESASARERLSRAGSSRRSPKGIPWSAKRRAAYDLARCERMA